MDKFTGWSENTAAAIPSQCAKGRIAEEGARIAENTDCYRGILAIPQATPNRETSIRQKNQVSVGIKG